jgi:hypothetical protein
MVAEAEVVVGAQHQDILAVNDTPGSARSSKNAEPPVQFIPHELLVLLI